MKAITIYIAAICIVSFGGVALGLSLKSEMGSLRWLLFTILSQIIIYPAVCWWLHKLKKNQHGKDI